ncbi:3-phosphoglycerate dehydrogenase [Paenibacillus baekrokdamisoli]|uniref:3-phosphoglycerate dehydrogenase n=1 Tax=Paenibacillus baekrokdamisoli TaxID=1712516 RepID=A0A3G9J6E3_9BACL|nr:D-2-hydroxyacid dehydrogenase [Paenibacillus baekrokdamisoli]MBB3070326.1 phosphoglycerate dehydrogenase-like enzyme [Paenibacillus baekrokdamisoli]BBH21331.1 3-phosphoglycerate dehydrogenase [Paenibacillus baekrokdamisoli]
MKKIVAARQLEPKHVLRIQEAASGWTFINGDNPETLQEHLLDAEIIIGWNKAVKKLLYGEELKLKWLQHFGAGVDHIPLEEIKRHGIYLTNASGVHPFPISETIFSMLLSFTRHLHLSIRNQQSRIWEGKDGMGEMHNRTIGILGVGAIGLETARIAKAFRMTVLGVRKSGQPAEGIDTMYTIDGLQEVLEKSDYIVNCLPSTKDTEHIIGKEQFAVMKPTAFYINIGRGKTTDTAALVEALEHHVIAGAGLDVFEKEPLPVDHPLWGLDNVIITPHTAGVTTAYDDRAMDIFMENLKAYISDGSPSVNLVDLKNEY